MFPVWTLTPDHETYMLFKMSPQVRRPLQLSLARKAGWGGARPGAGRPRMDGESGPAGVPHLRRPALDARQPVHVTLKVRREVWSLRSGRSVRALKRALLDVRQRQEQGVAQFAVVHFAILSNHLHLILEAGDRVALSRGMQSLEIRMARALNDSMERSGRVFADRYHAHILKTPTEVGRARRYVLLNASIHEARAGFSFSGPDGLTSAAMPGFASPARSWLLAHGWRRARSGDAKAPERDP
jgi:putative transposase